MTARYINLHFTYLLTYLLTYLPKDHGRDRFCATYVAGACHYGRPNKLASRLPIQKSTRYTGCCDMNGFHDFLGLSVRDDAT